MFFEVHSHRNALVIAENEPGYIELWGSFKDSILSITENDVAEHFSENHEGKAKSVSKSINSLIRERLTANGWVSEPRIFGEPGYSDSKRDKKWRLDFAKSAGTHEHFELEQNLEPTPGISVEVAFNNDGSTAWNLIKPVLAGELNHVRKETQTGMGVIVTATEQLKREGGFDSTVGTFDDFNMHLRPLRNLLTIPMIIVGLQPFDSFEIDVRNETGKLRGYLKKK